MIDESFLNSPGVDARSKRAIRRIKSFYQRFGSAHLLLAYHAAFPLALTPDLLYLLWANFQRNIHHTLLKIPWEAVADLLLSNLCDEVGYELYEMDTAVRNELLHQLENNPHFGHQRIEELSHFLLDYVRQQLNSHDDDLSDFARMQRWTALAYIQPDKAAHELALTLATWISNSSKSTQIRGTEFIRMASLVETLSEPLAGFEPLLNYTAGLAKFVRGDLDGAANQIQQVVEPGSLEVRIAEVYLTIPEQIWSEFGYRSESEQAIESRMKLAVGGPVQAKYGTYLPRPSDEELFRACIASKFAYVFACRQMGMSSLMFATSERLSQNSIRTAPIDLNSIGHTLESDNWYFSLIQELARRLRLNFDVEKWWEENLHLLASNQRFLDFLKEVVLKEILEPIVIFIDEIDMMLELPFADDFFATIRLIHDDRTHYPDFHRLSFVLLGVVTVDELIKDQTRSPFNIGQEIVLRDFTKDECDPLRVALEVKYPQQGRHYFDQVFEWTSGHPYLTQKICNAVLKADIQEAERDKSSLVDQLVRKLFLAQETRIEDNIQFVQTRVTRDAYAPEMLRIYKRILEENFIADEDQSPTISRLKLYGLAVARNSKLEVRNKLYGQVFDLLWVNEMLASPHLGQPNRYRILQEIGQGSFSTVYLAELHEADQTQTVALKVLKSLKTNDPVQVQYLKKELRVAARLEHPNIIHTLEISGDDAEPFFIVMEYIPGGTLHDKLKVGPLSRPEAIHIIRHIGAALSYIHQQGIIHRDVNPNNILLDTSQEPVRPVLIDFSLVKLLEPDDDNITFTSTQLMGTLPYMAPEQWNQDPLTPATDLYALAITFFEMLSGRCPFEGEDIIKIMHKHLDEDLPLLSEMVPKIGPFFDQVLRKAAAKNPSDRFPSIADFVNALEIANDQAEQAVRSTENENTTSEAKRTPSIKMDLVARRVWVNGREITPPLSVAQYKLLELLYNNVDAVVTRNHVAATIWSKEQFNDGVTDQSLDALVRRLRERIAEIDPENKYIRTIRGIGFQLIVTPESPR